jgi:hypothetical protein
MVTWPYSHGACGKAAHHSREHMLEQAAHLIIARSEKGEEETRVPQSPLRHSSLEALKPH